MKRYYVDVSGLDVNKKQEVYQLLDDYSYFTEIVQNNNNLEDQFTIIASRLLL